ncbi:ferric reductase-like transmembrane domain-containing protein [Streptomyces sp. NPDC002920]
MTGIAPGNQTVDPPRRSRALGVPRWLPRPTLIILRLLPLIPVLLATVLPAAALTGDDGAVATLKQNAAGILGNAALLSLAVTFAITPVTTVTGWRWHQILARDLGLWTFALAALDLVLAATMSTDGWRAGVAGQAFLAAGTLATLLLVPLAIASNRWSMRRFGSDWKRLHPGSSTSCWRPSRSTCSCCRVAPRNPGS